MTIKAEGADCENCPLKNQTFVPTIGPENAETILVGEAPGFHEAKQGRPFVGASGRLLNAVLAEYRIDRDSVRLTNTVLCRPPENRTPTKAEIACCSKRLELDVERCSTIVALGATASSAVMGQSVKITKFRAGPPKESKLYPGARVIPTIHPAACLRNGDQFPSLEADIKKINGTITTWTEPIYVVY